MTDELGATGGFRCVRCNTSIKLKRKQNRTLKVECDCITRSVKVKNAIPGVWTDE